MQSALSQTAWHRLLCRSILSEIYTFCFHLTILFLKAIHLHFFMLGTSRASCSSLQFLYIISQRGQQHLQENWKEFVLRIILGVANGFVSMRAVCLFLRTWAVVEFLLRAASTSDARYGASCVFPIVHTAPPKQSQAELSKKDWSET